jgi:hypothetical protein
MSWAGERKRAKARRAGRPAIAGGRQRTNLDHRLIKEAAMSPVRIY